ncbi:melanocortin receptor 4-like [Stylophora pistillata]|uniref:melanocortin receptor 4-like n=1 Tax=Stylophora pistillata TaxID=50429 RepID=UPI000C03B94A|nr:melanocortin receptor 4-like [Stylophora pistillata]
MEGFALERNFTRELTLNKTSSALPALGKQRHVFIPVLNIVLSMIATLGNVLILVALRKVSSLHPPTKLLFRCLAFTDLCVGLISQPLYAVAVMPRSTKINRDILSYFIMGNYVSSYILCGVSALTSTSISVDRLLALLLGLRYRQVVTLKRVRVLLSCLWAVSIFGGSMYLWSIRITWIVVAFFLILCLVTSIFSYIKIYIKLLEHQTRVQDSVGHAPPNGGGIPLNDMTRYQKTVSSISWVQLALIFCYAPYGIESILWIQGVTSEGAVNWLSTATLVYLNSSLNPILYCWKLREVRQAAKHTIKQMCHFMN